MNTTFVSGWYKQYSSAVDLNAELRMVTTEVGKQLHSSAVFGIQRLGKHFSMTKRDFNFIIIVISLSQNAAVVSTKYFLIDFKWTMYTMYTPEVKSVVTVLI